MTEQPIRFHHRDHAGSVETSCSRVPAVPTFPCKKIWSQWLYAICETFQIISSNNYDFQVLDLRRNHIFRISFCRENFSTGTLPSYKLRALQFFVSFPESIPLNNKSLKQKEIKFLHITKLTTISSATYKANINSLATETNILYCSHRFLMVQCEQRG